METLETGASTEVAGNGNTSTETTDENADGGTSTDGATEDAETLKQRLADKDAHISNLEKQIREGKAKPKSDPEDADDTMTWLTVNADGLKLVSKEYKEELAFYKEHKIPITNEIRDRALRDAQARKGVRSGETDRQVSTSTEVQGEMRKTTKTGEVPPEILKLNPGMTPERYAAYKAEFEAKDKKKKS